MASWRSARSARAVLRSSRCGVARSQCARSSSGSERSSAMARVVAFIPDLLFGSNVVGALEAAGHEVKLASAPAGEAEVLVVDLTSDVPERITAARSVMRPELKTLAFYSHVEADVRARAEEA